MTSKAYTHHFSTRNIPFGVVSSETHQNPQCVTRLANKVVFLDDWDSLGLFKHIDGLPTGVFSNDTLNVFAALPKPVHLAVR